MDQILSAEDIKRVAMDTEDGVRLRIKVNPRASKTRVLGIEEDYLRVALHASPVNGEANQELVRFLSKQLRIAQKHVHLLRGVRSRSKIIHIENCSLKHLENLLKI